MIVKCVLGVIGSWGAVLGCSETSRGDAAAVWRGYSVEATRGDAAATTWNFGWLGPVHANVMYGGDVDKDAHDITWFYAGWDPKSLGAAHSCRRFRARSSVCGQGAWRTSAANAIVNHAHSRAIGGKAFLQ